MENLFWGFLYVTPAFSTTLKKSIESLSTKSINPPLWNYTRIISKIKELKKLYINF